MELKENIKRQWWKAMVQQRDDMVGLDSSVILPRQVWEASGHVDTFTDPLTECQSCHKRFRADHLQEEVAEKKGLDDPDESTWQPCRAPTAAPAAPGPSRASSPACSRPTSVSSRTRTGLHYLRPETAQGIFVNFANVVTSSRMKPPFGIAQIGKSFRNEITPGNFIFRTREFEQMEMEFFVKPGEDKEWHQYWIDERTRWYTDLGIDPDNLRHFEHPQEKLSHYSTRTVDIEYRFRFQGSEWGELEGIANRTDFDLQTHAKHSGQDLSYFDQAANERYYPYVIEPAGGLSRSLMTFLVDAYHEDEAPNTKGGVDKRVVLKLDPRLAPVKVAVLPLSRNADLSPKARDLADRAAQELARRLRRLRGDRPPLPPPGRDRYAVLRHGRLRDARRQRGHRPLPRHDGAGAGADRRHHVVLRRAIRRVLTPAARHNGPVVRQSLRRVGSSLAAVVLLASAGLLAVARTTRRAPMSGASGSPDASGSASESESTEPSLPVPEGVELSPEGSQFEVDDTATVAYELRQGVVGVLDIRVSRLEKTRFKKSFVGWDLDQGQKKSNPYFVRATITNRGETDLGGKKVPLYIVDGDQHPGRGHDVRQRVPTLRARCLPQEVQARPDDEGLPGLPRAQEGRPDRGELPADAGLRPDHLDRRAPEAQAPEAGQAGQGAARATRATRATRARASPPTHPADPGTSRAVAASDQA